MSNPNIANEHKLTREESSKGGKTLTAKKYKSLQLNPLKSGRYSKVLSGSIDKCDDCKYCETCTWHEKGASCQIFIKQVKAINKLGKDITITELAINYVMSLQRFAREMMELNTENDKLQLEVEKYEKELKELELERKHLSNTTLINTNKRERMQIRGIVLSFMGAIRDNKLRYPQMEKDYMSKITEFKKMVLGDKVTIEAKIKVNTIAQEMEAAYTLFKKGEAESDFIVKQ